MKKALLLPVIAVLIFFSCKRDHSTATNPSGKKYKVSFNVSNFSVKQGSMSAGRHINALSSDTLTNLNGYLDLLYYVVYGDFGHAVKLPIVQDSTMADMGTITDSLPSGTYEIVFIGGKKGLAINDYGFIGTSSFGYGDTKWQDVFHSSFLLTVDNNNISKTVTMNRVVGKLELKLLDNIPANADSLTMTIDPETKGLANDGGQPLGQPFFTATYSVAIPAAAKGHPNFTLDRLIGNTLTPFTVTILCKDSNGQIVGYAKADNVNCDANVKTILSGNLFNTNPATQNFTVKVDTAWANSNPYSF